MNWIKSLKRPVKKVTQTHDIPDDLWDKCAGCGSLLFHTEVEKNLNEILPIEEKTKQKIIEYRTLAFDALKLPEN